MAAPNVKNIFFSKKFFKNLYFQQPIQNAFNLPLPQRIMPYGIVAAAVGVASYFVLCAVNPFGIRKLKGKEKN